MFFTINNMRLKARLASAAAATAITCMMLVSVSLGFPRLANANELQQGAAAGAASVTTAKMEFAS